MGLDLSSDDISALESRTEGWIAGLQLAALSLQGRNNVQNFVQAFTGSHRYVIDYLADEVLTRQPDTTRQFLLQTAVLGRLSGPLCDAVTDRTDSQQVLETLEATNLFLIPLDDERRWYRYHHLFSDVLREHLQQNASEQKIATLHQRASHWYAANDLPEDAVDHALAAGDLDQAIELVESIAISMLVHGEIVILMRWLDVLPDESIMARPRLTLAKAWAMGIMSHWNEITPLIDHAEQKLLATQMEDGDNAEIQGMLGEVSAMRAMIASFNGYDIPMAIKLSQHALQQLPEVDETLIVRGVLTYNMAMGFTFLNDFEQGRETLIEARALSKAGNNLIVAVLSINSLASLEMEQGRLREAADLYREALDLTCHDPRHQGKHHRPLPIGGRSYLDLAEIYREWNDFVTAKEYLDIACKLGEAKGAMYVIELSNVVLARILQAEGDLKGALAAIEKAVELTPEESDIVAWVPAVRARLWLMQGNITDAARWAETCGLPLGDDFHYTQFPGEYSTLVRVWLAKKQFDDAWKLLQRMQRAAEESGRTGRLIEVLILQALTLATQNQTDEALPILAQALSLAEPGGYIRLFVDEGKPMQQLLQRMKPYDVRAEGGRINLYVEQLLSAFDRSDSSPLPSLITPQALIEPLSDRELEVLHLIAEGLSNREIAQRLVITVGTTKTHINNIYRKLEVRSRTQALARAGELQLL
jgi:LuxR family maltose regulon positive regulatory protein